MLLILPTAAGKTAVSMLIAEILQKTKDGFFIAPTGALVDHILKILIEP